MPKAKYTQRYDGEGFEVPNGKIYRLACCDCGLVHDMVFVAKGKGPIGIAAKRNNKATAQRRRYNPIDFSVFVHGKAKNKATPKNRPGFKSLVRKTEKKAM